MNIPFYKTALKLEKKMNTDKSDKKSSPSKNKVFSLAKQLPRSHPGELAEDVAAGGMGVKTASGTVPLALSETVISVRAGGGAHGKREFLGEVRFWWRTSGDIVLFEKVEYKIDQGSPVQGGNSANVIVRMYSSGDHGFETDKGFQDNTWRTLSTNFGIPKNASIKLTCTFVFDRSVAADPEGSESATIYP
ncbi:hypothetical protein VKY20_08630 [Pseudomonas atacamensis]|uniref:hypothetical protein n=1 Tax=Pseudomonas atacamensis TaxID=2565368 RepID=UPI002B4889FE|nr:hypothetical protein [Pseudomonas atacamensis]MEB2855668.1 hypothetical protein [Pseudomonas atacamensis]